MSIPHRPASATLFFVILAAFLALVLRLDFLCDDAFISFRYAAHLAEGLGLRYNPGEQPPVEGYSNFLWIVWLAGLERIGFDILLFSRLTSAALGFHIMLVLARWVARWQGSPWWNVPAGLLFLAALPPFATWSTGGLETMAFAWALFLAYHAGASDPARIHGVRAGVFALLACLLRADGFVFVGLTGLAVLFLRGHELRSTRTALLAAAGIPAAGLAVYLVWRLVYFGEILPNTATVKVEIASIRFEQGAKYVVSTLLTFPSLIVPLFSPLAFSSLARAGTGLDSLLRATWLVLAGGVAYFVFVGGDYMPMARFFVPLLPFFALAFTLQVHGWLRAVRSPALAAAACAVVPLLSLPPAFGAGRPLVPFAVIERLHYRWSLPQARTELAALREMREETVVRRAKGLTLARISAPGDSVVLGAIGATGYYSRLYVFDRNGLVTPDVLGAPDNARRSPGHWHTVPPTYFADRRPSILDAQIVGLEGGASRPIRSLEADGYEWERIELLLEEGLPPGSALRVLRRRDPDSSASAVPE